MVVGPLQSDPSWEQLEKPGTAPVPVLPTQPASPLQVPSFAPTSSPPPETRSILRWLLPVVGFVAFISFLIGLSEAGVMSLGIEQLWGLSNRAEQAIAIGAQTLTGSQNYRVSGRVTLAEIMPVSQGTTGPGQLLVEFVQDRTATASKITGNVTFHAAVGQEQLFGSLLAGGAPVSFEIIQSEGDLYLRLNNVDPVDRWQKVSFDQLADLGVKVSGWPALVDALTQSVSKGRRLPKQQLENVSTKGYETQVPVGTIASPFTTTVFGNQQLVTKSQLGIGDKRPYALALDGPFETETLRGTTHAAVNFSSFGQVPAVVVPTPDKVKNTVPLTFMSDHGLLGATSLAGRDVRRKADLQTIAIALIEYAVAGRPFAYPKTEGVMRLEQGSEVAKALSPYLTVLPSDPLAADRYYGYRSDGTAFELTASLENTADPTGNQAGSLVLYSVKSQ